MAALSPRLRWALAAVLALTVFAALQPPDDDDLAVEGAGRQGRGRPVASGERRDAGNADREATLPSGTGARPAGRGRPVVPDAAQARQLAQLAVLWRQRQAVAGPVLPPLSTGRAGVSSQPLIPSPWASQQPPPPPPQPPAPIVVEAPQAPRFPYKWVGRYVDDSPRAVVAGPSQTWVLRRGDLLEGQWRVDAIGERQMTLMYLPLNQAQAVDLK